MATVAGFRFDEKTAQQLSMIYQTDDIKEMQRQYRVWFDPRPGERILDVGCGTGVNGPQRLNRLLKKEPKE